MQETLNLKAPPSSWVELTGQQMEELCRIKMRCSDMETYKMRSLFYLCGLTQLPTKQEDGYLVAKIDDATQIAVIRPWEVKYWCDQYMQFLERPFEVWNVPYPNGLQVGQYHLKAPDCVLSNLTYQQYQEVQRAMREYWQVGDQLVQLNERIARYHHSMLAYGDDPAIVRQHMDLPSELQHVEELQAELRQYRNTFLAHLLIPVQYKPFTKLRRFLGRIVTEKVEYKWEVAEQLIQLVDRIPEPTFQVLLQQVQSGLAYFAKSYPELFRSSSRNDGPIKDELVMECDTVEAVKKYANYPLVQDVYNENAVLIFSVLNTMAKEQKMIEEQNAKLKH